MLHVWYIYLHLGHFDGANVGKYSIYGAYCMGMEAPIETDDFPSDINLHGNPWDFP